VFTSVVALFLCLLAMCVLICVLKCLDGWDKVDVGVLIVG